MTYCIVTLFFTLKGLKDMGKRTQYIAFSFHNSTVVGSNDYRPFVYPSFCMKCPKYSNNTSISFNFHWPKARQVNTTLMRSNQINKR